MAELLTRGCLMHMMTGVDYDKPVVQILGSKRIAGDGETPRYRLLISDGIYLQSFAMLSTQLNHLLESSDLCDNTIIRINRYIVSLVNRTEHEEKRVLIILEVSVLRDGKTLEKIGAPTNIQDALPKKSSTQTSAPVASTSNSSGPTASNFSAKTLVGTTPVNLNSSLTDQPIFPIRTLSPYQNKWTIKARVTNKTNIRSWSNPKGEGTLFSMDLMDESGEIRLTAFKEQCDKFYDIIEIDKVYYISKCQLKPANKRFSNINNEYEMTCTGDTIITECFDNSQSIPVVQFNLTPISQLADLEDSAVVDILGVCREAAEVVQFTAKTTNKEMKKREVTLVDTSLASINLTLWGEDAVRFDGSAHPVILVKGGRLKEFNGGKTLGMIGGSVMKINPDINETYKLRLWFDGNNIQNISATSLSARASGSNNMASEWMNFNEVNEKSLGKADRADYFQIKAYIHNIRSNAAVYKACPSPECNKKIVDQENGQFRCEKCNTNYPNFKYRLLLNILIGDYTSNRWVTCFTDVAEQLLGKTSQEVGELLEINKENISEFFKSFLFKSYIFKLRIKEEFYGDKTQKKTTVMNISPVNHKEYNIHLIQRIEKLTGIQSI